MVVRIKEEPKSNYRIQKWAERKSGCFYAVVTGKGLLLCGVDVKFAVAGRSV